MLRTIHISDIHLERGFRSVPLRHFANKRLVGLMNLSLRRRKHFSEAWRKLAALGQLLDREQVDLLLCTGDYTALGTEPEIVLARETIDEVRGQRPLYTVPGNHDVYVPQGAEHFEHYFAEELTSDRPELCTDGVWPWVREHKHAVFVGVNSARPNPEISKSSGEIPAAQLDTLSKLIQLPEYANRWFFVLTHYAPFRWDGKPDTKHHGLDNADDLMRVLKKHPKSVLLHGHVHRPFRLSRATHGVEIFCAASTTQRNRNGMWCFDIYQDTIEARQGLWAHGSFELSAPIMLS